MSPRMSNLLKSLFRGLRYPEGPEVILMISQPATSNEVDLMSRIFDKVLIPVSDSNIAILRSASSLSRSNILCFVLKGLPIGWSLHDAISVRAAKWIVRDSLAMIAIEQPPTMDEISCAQAGKSQVGYILMSGNAEVFEGPNHFGLTEDHEILETPPSSSGLICRGLCQQTRTWDSKPDFVILQDDETIKEAIVSAAKSDIRSRLFSGRSGLESY